MLSEKESINVEKCILEIVERIKKLKPVKIILFGSYAWGGVHKDSDIDLIIILNKDGIPKDFREKMDSYLSVKRLLRDINGEIPMDIIVYTKGQWKKFLLLDSCFTEKVVKKGKVLYERNI
jgi:Nucleotidyltransferase domain.